MTVVIIHPCHHYFSSPTTEPISQNTHTTPTIVLYHSLHGHVTFYLQDASKITFPNFCVSRCLGYWCICKITKFGSATCVNRGTMNRYYKMNLFRYKSVKAISSEICNHWSKILVVKSQVTRPWTRFGITGRKSLWTISFCRHKMTSIQDDLPPMLVLSALWVHASKSSPTPYAINQAKYKHYLIILAWGFS